MSESIIAIGDSKSLLAIFGVYDQHLRKIRRALGVSISAQEGRIHVRGSQEAVTSATLVLEELQAQVERQGAISAEDVDRVLNRYQRKEVSYSASPVEVFGGRMVRPRSAGQAQYLEAIRQRSIVFCIGPAGTGKTYLAVAMAVAALKEGAVRKLVLVRPAVEAGESLGYLPGDLEAKIHPYLRPLFDALREMMEFDLIQRYKEQELIEVLPLAYMRGRTLNQAFLILDEAQNTTIGQMKMFLTRMGQGSKAVVCGDITQVDLVPPSRSGLVDAIVRLKEIEGIAVVQLRNEDIVRHPLVQQIVDAYAEPGKPAPEL
ncbi:MAG TPA: PhoH family protein [Thermoguttaceae bacterium]|nr:PhoH family protein [Thermoguttaceae bacterium]HPP52214.1 PhoH family protein [Thermoguttaceae bacterium]